MSRFFFVVFVGIIVLQEIWIPQIQAARILVFFPMASSSHFILGNAFAQELVNKGHNVTFINAIGVKEPRENLKDVVLDELAAKTSDIMKSNMPFTEKSPISIFLKFITVTYLITEEIFKQPKIQDFLSKDDSFDLIISEIFLNEAHFVFAHHFNCPLIIFSTVGANTWVNNIVSNEAPPSYVPQMTSSFPDKMNFWERVQNTLTSYVMELIYSWYHIPRQDALLRKYYPTDLGVAEIIKERKALVFVNSHLSFEMAKPTVPNLIEIGGYHIAEPQPLPEHLKEYLDGAKQGFILFSMGSIFKSTTIPPETRNMLMRIFSELPYKILWKFEDDELPGKPDNVKTAKWLPQNDILAHPNLKLFITHGGLLSTTEAVFHGVPIVGIPVFGDQEMNMITAERLGIGKAVPFQTLNYDTLKTTVLEVLENKSYRESALQRSAILRDQPLRPLDTAMYWTEYVLRHGYCQHLQTSAVNLAWYEQQGLDVLALLFTIFGFVIMVSYRIIKYSCRRKEDKKLDRKKKQ